ncbi:hypothetical protein A6R68_19993 [Neotoma lepida]|uniref:Secreted protein n=1 Tax=Neotoma lepida TaxID=56216 RepID=A0A1A6HHA8_NEOLE|nr:hypothetical protein A6R68_19993 [Neotoma lepida]
MKWTFLTLDLLILLDTPFHRGLCEAGGYMVFLFHKPCWHVPFIQNPKFSNKTPPELRAAQCPPPNVVFSLFLLDRIFFLENNSLIVNIREFLILSYAILRPLALIHRDGHHIEFCHAPWETQTLRNVSIAVSGTLDNAFVQNVFFRSMSSITDAFLKEFLHPGYKDFYLGRKKWF